LGEVDFFIPRRSYLILRPFVRGYDSAREGRHDRLNHRQQELAAIHIQSSSQKQVIRVAQTQSVTAVRGFAFHVHEPRI